MLSIAVTGLKEINDGKGNNKNIGYELCSMCCQNRKRIR
jgi:hypothetical protein